MQVNNFIRKSIEYHKSQFAINHHKSKTKRVTAKHPKSKIENQQYKNTKSKSSIQVTSMTKTIRDNKTYAIRHAPC